VSILIGISTWEPLTDFFSFLKIKIFENFQRPKFVKKQKIVKKYVFTRIKKCSKYVFTRIDFNWLRA
jgi:hypothetical protein